MADFPLRRFQQAGVPALTVSQLQDAWALLSPAVQDAEVLLIEGMSNYQIQSITSFPTSGGAIPTPTGFGGQIIEIAEGGQAGLPVPGATASSLLVTDASGNLASGPATSSVVTASPTGGIPAWVTGTVYPVNVLVSNGGTNYICNTAHTAAATFGADAANWTALGSGGGGGVASVAAGDTSIVVGGTGTNPTLETATLDVIATDHPPAAAWSNNSKKITSLANGSGAQDAVAFGQLAAFALIVENVNVVGTSGATQTLPDVTADTCHLVTLTANCTFTFPTAAAGKSFVVALVQDATPRTVTWPGTVKWPGGVAPVLSTGANATDVFSFVCLDGTHWLGFVMGQNF